MAELFYNTVQTINAKDYAAAQRDVWATGKVDITAWNQSFLKHDTVPAVMDRIIVGFFALLFSVYRGKIL